MDSDPADLRASRTPPAGVTLTRATWDDVDDVAALVVATERDRLGSSTFRPVDLRTRWLGAIDFDDTILLRDDAGRLLAYAEFHADDDPDAELPDLFVEGRVHPRATGRGFATFLLERAVLRARRAARTAGVTEAVLETLVTDGDDRARAFFAGHDFHPYRHLLDMRLDLAGPLPEPDVPDGVVVRGFDELRPEDVDRLWRVHRRGFADVPTHLPLDREDFVASRITGDDHHDPTLWLAAEADGQLVGMTIARLGGVGAAEAGWIRDLAVVPAWRRRGLAMAMLRRSFVTLRQRGASAVQLEVDDVTLDGAVALYRRAGMQVVRRTDLLARRISTGQPHRAVD